MNSTSNLPDSLDEDDSGHHALFRLAARKSLVVESIMREQLKSLQSQGALKVFRRKRSQRVGSEPQLCSETDIQGWVYHEGFGYFAVYRVLGQEWKTASEFTEWKASLVTQGACYTTKRGITLAHAATHKTAWKQIGRRRHPVVKQGEHFLLLKHARLCES